MKNPPDSNVFKIKFLFQQQNMLLYLLIHQICCRSDIDHLLPWSFTHFACPCICLYKNFTDLLFHQISFRQTVPKDIIDYLFR